MNRRVTLGILVGLLSCGGLGADVGYRLWDRCSAESLVHRLVAILPKDQDRDGFVIFNVHLLPHQLFAWPYRCEADITPIRGNVDLSSHPWQHVRYEVSIVKGDQQVRLLP